MVKDMCGEANVKGQKTNYSLRATGATALYKAGVPEKAIQERTGHMSLTGLRHYERTDTEQQKAISKVLANPERNTFQEQYFARSNVVQGPPNPTQNYSFANCQVNIYNNSNSTPSHHQQDVQVSALRDATNQP